MKTLWLDRSRNPVWKPHGAVGGPSTEVICCLKNFKITLAVACCHHRSHEAPEHYLLTKNHLDGPRQQQKNPQIVPNWYFWGLVDSISKPLEIHGDKSKFNQGYSGTSQTKCAETEKYDGEKWILINTIPIDFLRSWNWLKSVHLVFVISLVFINQSWLFNH